MATHSRYIVGIDLGTTNSVVAFVDARKHESPASGIRVFPISQIVAPGETASRSMLPSFLYLAGQHELPPGADRLPWSEATHRIVGEFARVQGARVPGRLVSSAKSWMCHGGVDREADILPWGAPLEVPHVSPVSASTAYLGHVRDAWNHQMASSDPNNRLENQDIVLTVPASFDEAARELTVQAASKAGLNQHLTLLEEPQAAFYSWIVSHHDVWQREVRSGELILVCDIGGGTTDFSLITVVETETGPGFKRVAVGDHLMLGGDNMDLALAHLVESKLGGRKLDTEQWNSLRFACREAKERLLGQPAPESLPVLIAGRGSRLVGSSIKSELSKEEVLRTVLEGFFPIEGAFEEPKRSGRSGLQEFGLPFVADSAITRHLISFLRKHAQESPRHDQQGPSLLPSRPNAILFNGGALTPAPMRERIVRLLSSQAFTGDTDPQAQPPRVLFNDSLDLAVGIGAAYYGLVRRHGGIRIGGGTARSFYVGFETADAQSRESDRSWLCVVPRDAQEGDEISIAGHDIDLLTARPVIFPMATSSVRPQDKPGDLVPPNPDSIRELPPLLGTMRVGRKAKAERVPVQIAAKVTEVGTLELWCKSRGDERRWRLQLQFRGITEEVKTSAPAAGVSRSEHDGGIIIEQSNIDAACHTVKQAFLAADPRAESGVSRLVKNLESAMDENREQWPLSALRALWEPLREVIECRLASPRHESRWLNLAGYCLRPGTGFPLDESRIKALWPIFHQGLKHIKDTQCWAEWWILWRRVAAGLNRSHQDELFRRLSPYLLPPRGGAGKKPIRPRPEPHELAEMWRCGAALERLPANVKETLGEAMIAQLSRRDLPKYVPWCLGRLGARSLLYGPANTVVPPDTASRWVSALLAQPLDQPNWDAEWIFALTQIARISGDRARDLDDSLRGEVLLHLTKMNADTDTLNTLREYHELQEAQQNQVLGDSLPIGLRLASETPAGG